MNEITISTQAEWDALPRSFPEYTLIRIHNTPERLHLSPRATLARSFGRWDGLLLLCKARTEDIVVYPYNIEKVRCRKVTVVGRCDIRGELIGRDGKE